MATFRMNKSQLPKPLSAETLQASADRIRGTIRPSSDEISDTIKAPTSKKDKLNKIKTLILFGSLSAGLVGLNILVMPTKLSSTKADKAELKAAPKPVVVTPKTYYDSTKDECHVKDGSGVLINFAKGLAGAEILCDKLFSTYNIEEYAKEKDKEDPGALVAPGRYDMALLKKLRDERERREAPPEIPIYDTLAPDWTYNRP